MRRTAKPEAIAAIESARLVPLFFHPDPEVGCRVADALFAGGCTVLEFTNRGEGAFEAFSALARHVKEHHPGAILGAGSVHDPKTAEHFLGQGADFIVGATFHPEIATQCRNENVLYVPGCGTATEIMTATEAGCGVVKIFPADTLGGPNFIKALRGPFPWLRAIPAGGVKATRESLKAWYDAGAVAVCMGSDLASAERLQKHDYAGLKSAAMTAVSIVEKLN